jgi:hypothetical protein
MRYRWLAIDHEPFPSGDLLAEIVQPPLVSSRDAEAVQLVSQFAHTFKGYDWAGSLKQLAARYRQVQRSWLDGNILPYDADGLRAYLFLWVRGPARRRGRTDRGRPRNGHSASTTPCSSRGTKSLLRKC